MLWLEIRPLISRGPGSEEAASFGERSMLQGFLARPHLELHLGLEAAELQELPTLTPAQHPAVAKFSANPEHYRCIFCAERTREIAACQRSELCSVKSSAHALQGESASLASQSET